MTLRFFASLAAALCIFVLSSAAHERVLESLRSRAADEITAESVRLLSDRDLVSQVFTFLLPLEKSDDLNKLRPGGIFIHGKNIPQVEDNQDPDRLSDAIAAVNDWYDSQNLPRPLYNIDQEGGHVKRLNRGVELFPSAMAFSEASASAGGDVAAAAVSVCGSLKKMGISWILAPVADIQNNPENPVIRTRSFSSNPVRVAELAGVYADAATAAGCLTTWKHFPGHGNTDTDSHLSLPVLNHTLSEVEETELRPFRPLRGSDEYSVMAAHLLFPQADSSPASVSRFWLTEVLRESWHFSGMIISDDLAMKGIRNLYENRLNSLPVDAFLAGTDMLLVVNEKPEIFRAYHDAMMAQLPSAEFRERLRQSAARILKAKLRTGDLLPWLKKNRESLPEHTTELLDFYRRSTPARKAGLTAEESAALNRRISAAAIRRLYGGTPPLPAKSTVLINIRTPQLRDEILLKIPAAVEADPDSKETYSGDVILLDEGRTTPVPLLASLRPRISGSLAVYSGASPFPASAIIRNLRENDVFISSFSDTPESVRALVSAALSGAPPEKAAVLYSE